MKKTGYIVKNKNTVYIDAKAKIGENVIIYDNTRIEGSCEIGDNVTIYPNSFIVGSTIGKGTKVHASVIENSKIGSCCSIGAYSCIKCGSKVSSFVKIGMGTIVKNTEIGEYCEVGLNASICGAKIKRHCKISSGAVLEGSNEKSKRDIELNAGVIVGSNACIIAPAKLLSGEVISAGSIVSKK